MERSLEDKKLVEDPGGSGPRASAWQGHGSLGVRGGTEQIDRQRKKDRAERVGARYDWWIGEARGNASTGGLVRRALPQ